MVNLITNLRENEFRHDLCEFVSFSHFQTKYLIKALVVRRTGVSFSGLEIRRGQNLFPTNEVRARGCVAQFWLLLDITYLSLIISTHPLQFLQYFPSFNVHGIFSPHTQNLRLHYKHGSIF